MPTISGETKFYLSTKQAKSFLFSVDLFAETQRANQSHIVLSPNESVSFSVNSFFLCTCVPSGSSNARITVKDSNGSEVSFLSSFFFSKTEGIDEIDIRNDNTDSIDLFVVEG